MIQQPRALISTIQPFDGGVPAKLRWVIRQLHDLGITPVVAWYEPWSRSPSLSVPLHALATGRRPSARVEVLDLAPNLHSIEGHAIGAWLPELEFTHYRPGDLWRELIASCDLHLAITGNPLCASRFATLGLPFLAWVGSDWHGDRVDRVLRFSGPRRLLDRAVNSPRLRQLERAVLLSPGGCILTISQVTANMLSAIGGRPMDGVLYLPPDPDQFQPLPQSVVPWRIGFSGRYGDPRKNISLLLQAVTRLAAEGHGIELHLTGERDGQFLRPVIDALRLGDRVVCHPFLSPTELAGVLKSLDLFVIPSHQEGLCIAALEAMACGVPVVSTRCGGPEDFVLEGQTGSLVDPDPQEMALSITRICSDRQLRQRLGAGAREWVEANASENAVKVVFRQHLAETFPLLMMNR